MSLFHVIEEVHAPSYPHVIPQLVAVAQWNMDDSELDNDYQVQFVICAGEETEKIYSQNFTASRPRQRTMLAFAGFPIPTQGKHKIEIRLNNEPKATHEIYAQIIVSPPMPVILPSS